MSSILDDMNDIKALLDDMPLKPIFKDEIIFTDPEYPHDHITAMLIKSHRQISFVAYQDEREDREDQETDILLSYEQAQELYKWLGKALEVIG